MFPLLFRRMDSFRSTYHYLFPFLLQKEPLERYRAGSRRDDRILTIKSWTNNDGRWLDWGVSILT